VVLGVDGQAARASVSDLGIGCNADAAAEGMIPRADEIVWIAGTSLLFGGKPPDWHRLRSGSGVAHVRVDVKWRAQGRPSKIGAGTARGRFARRVSRCRSRAGPGLTVAAGLLLRTFANLHNVERALRPKIY